MKELIKKVWNISEEVLFMKAAIVRRTNEIFIGKLPKPKIRPEEALVKVKYAGICGTDIHVYKGLHPTAKFPLRRVY